MRVRVVPDLFDVVTARAVAPMDRLSAWALPLVRSDVTFLSMKGPSVQAELERCFPHDIISPVPKGVRGADLLQEVRNGAPEAIVTRREASKAR